MSYDLKTFFSMNKQKIIIAALSILIVILLIIAILLIFAFKNKTQEEKDLTKFLSSSKNVSLTLPDSLDMDIVTDRDYELLLNSIHDGNAIGISKTQKNPLYTFEQFINSDRETYISSFENPKNVTDISSGTVNDIPYYKYSFNTNESYIEVYWIERNDAYYIIDFACDTKSGSSDLKGNIQEIMNSLTFNS